MPIRFLDEEPRKPRVRFLDEIETPKARFLDEEPLQITPTQERQPISLKNLGNVAIKRTAKLAGGLDVGLPVDPLASLGQAAKGFIGGPEPIKTRLKRDVVSAGAGLASGFTGAIPATEAALGVETDIGKSLQNVSQDLRQFARKVAPKDPNVVDKLVSGGTSMALFMVPSVSGAKAVSLIPGFARVAAKLAPAIGTGISTVLESAIEQGDVFNDLIEKGTDRLEAGRRAAADFMGNAILIGLTNRFGLFGKNKTILKNAIKSAPLEGLQEAGQQILSDTTKGEDIKWPVVVEAAGLGAVLGGIAGGIVPLALDGQKQAPTIPLERTEQALISPKPQEQAPIPPTPLKTQIQPELPGILPTEQTKPPLPIQPEVVQEVPEITKAPIIAKSTNGPESRQRNSEAVYAQNRARKTGLVEEVKGDLVKVAKDVALQVDKTIGVISTRLKNIDPSLKTAVRKFEFDVRMSEKKDFEAIKPALDVSKKMSRDDKADFDLARKNGDPQKLREMIAKYKMGTEYNRLRKTFNDIHKRAKEVGFDIGYRKHFHPRMVKDKEGFLAYFNQREDWSIFDDAIRAKETKLGRTFTESERVSFLNTMIRGFQSGKILLSETGSMKARTVDFVDAELNRFYHDSDTAAALYVAQVNEAIEMRKFFGKELKPKGEVDPATEQSRKEGLNTLEDSVGAYVSKLLVEGKVKPSQEQELMDILRARFGAVGTSKAVGIYKNLSYIDTLGSPISALTQFGDLGFALYKSGPKKTIGSLIDLVRGKTEVSREDIGVTNIAAEFGSPSKSVKALDAVFKMTGLTQIDALGKLTLINSALAKFRAKAVSDPVALKTELQAMFEGETDSVINDLKNKQNTENVKFLLFNELLDVQPVALSEVPERYLTGGNGRVFYILKTFQIKLLDVFRNEAFQKMEKKGTFKEGFQNLLKLGSAMIVMGASVDELKDFILGRKTSWSDRVIDNVLKLVGFSKFTIYQARREGIGSAALRVILPPFKFIDALYKDILTFGDQKGWQITGSIPEVGKLYYWWFGRGVGIKQKQEKRRRNPTIPEIVSGAVKGSIPPLFVPKKKGKSGIPSIPKPPRIPPIP
jgi:hypothetical protein